MGVSLSIKNVPEALAEALRQRATANHRSLQRELLAIVEAAAASTTASASTRAFAAPPAVRETDGPYAVALLATAGPDDGLLTELDAIVAGSRWGHAPLLGRDEAHDRELTRSLDLDARADELAQARQRARRGAAP